MLFECDVRTCPAGTACKNTRIQRRAMPPLTPFKTDHRGWGLKCDKDLEPVCGWVACVEICEDLLCHLKIITVMLRFSASTFEYLAG